MIFDLMSNKLADYIHEKISQAKYSEFLDHIEYKKNDADKKEKEKDAFIDFLRNLYDSNKKKRTKKTSGFFNNTTKEIETTAMEDVDFISPGGESIKLKVSKFLIHARLKVFNEIYAEIFPNLQKSIKKYLECYKTKVNDHAPLSRLIILYLNSTVDCKEHSCFLIHKELIDILKLIV
jgi:hypothetical protein